MKFLYLILILLINISCIAQDESILKKSNISLIKTVFSNNIDTVDSKYNGTWAGIEIGFNNYFNSSKKSFDLSENENYLEIKPWKSRVININLIEFNLGIIKKSFGITTGCGIEINNFLFSQNITLVSDSLRLNYFQDTINTFSKNKLTTLFVSVPLLLEWHLSSKKNKSIAFISLGIIGSVNIDNYTSQRYSINNVEYKSRIRDNYWIAPYWYGLTARFGYSFIRFFANYSLMPLFEINKGPTLYLVSAGVIIVGF